jgi:hypothetical protein
MRQIGFFIFLLILASCNQAEEKPSKLVYTDIKAFFESEAKRLTKNKTLVNKTIQQNRTSESKSEISINWQDEFILFIASDINKPAWKDSYKIIDDPLKTSYHSIDSGLRTKEIQINKDVNGKPTRFYIKNINKNNLYESTEILIYIPDSAYSIEKSQSVLLLGKNNLLIKAEIIK